MAYYNGETGTMSVAHFCRNFRSSNTAAKMSVASEGISCSCCANWGSKGCMKEAFENLSSDMDYI